MERQGGGDGGRGRGGGGCLCLWVGSSLEHGPEITIRGVGQVTEIAANVRASMSDITLVHKQEYVQELRQVVEATTEPRGIADLDTPDELTYVTSSTFDDALLVRLRPLSILGSPNRQSVAVC